jgi:uncharacterized protein YfcZ (UPF0381/DUF406 family)
MPTKEVKFYQMLDEDNKVAEVYHLDNGISFPVPISELEPIKEWPKTWEELNVINGNIIGRYSTVDVFDVSNAFAYKSVFATHQQAESALAMSQLSQLHKAIVGDWEVDWSDKQTKWCISVEKYTIYVGEFSVSSHHFAFQTKEQAEFSLKHHRELWEKFYMIKK